MRDKSSEFRWVGEPTWKETALTTKYYKSFCHDGLLISLNDDVLIRNSDNVDNSDDFQNCFLGRVEALYNRENHEDGDCHRAVIRWYSRAEELPVRHKNQYRKYMKIDSLPEVFINVQPFDKDIDAETIFGKCKIIQTGLDLAEISMVTYKDIGIPCFFVRLKYNGKTLLPIEIKEDICEKRDRSRSSRVQKETKRTQARTRTGLRPKSSTYQNGTIHSDTESSMSDLSEEIPLQYPIPTKVARTGNISTSSSNPSSGGDSKNSQSSPFKSFYKPSQLKPDQQQLVRKLTFQSPKKVTPIKIIMAQGEQIVSRVDKKSTTSSSIRQSPRLIKGASKDSAKHDGVKRNLLDAIKGVTSGKCHKTHDSPQTRKSTMNLTRNISSSSSKVHSKQSSSGPNSASCVLRSRITTKKKPSEDDDSDFDESRSQSNSEDSSIDYDEVCDKVITKKTRGSSAKKAKTPTPTKLRTPSIPKRESKCHVPVDLLQEIQERLHVAAVPDALPCRENEFAEVYAFVEGKLTDGTGGCMYISGVPGTGKTATVHEVIRSLQEGTENGNIPAFKFISINGMKLTHPRQAYVQIYKDLTGEKTTVDHAVRLLEKKFRPTNGKRERIILLVDELDLLCTQKQDVMYNLFDWPNKQHSRLIVLAIANTMDLPERMMKNRVASRMGLTRLTFQPYNFKQLQTILMARMRHSNVFNADAVQLVARKVAALSGDARRALDICRRATEIAAQLPNSPTKRTASLIGMQEVDRALQEMFSLPKTESIRNASCQEKLFLRAIVSEFQRIGLEEATFASIYQQHCALCRLEGVEVPNFSQAMAICYKLGSCRLLLLENGMKDIHQRIRLNISTDELTYALKDDVS